MYTIFCSEKYIIGKIDVSPIKTKQRHSYKLDIPRPIYELDKQISKDTWKIKHGRPWSSGDYCS